LILAVLAAVLVSIFVASPAEAALDVKPNKNALKNEVNTAADNIVTFVRAIFGVVVAVLFVWGAFLLLGGSSNPQRMASAKSKFGYAILALIVVFMADRIVSLIMGLFGLKL
ncbi:MAG: TrbC/VirB2 family protein, partial [Novibacillus thermophilus]